MDGHGGELLVSTLGGYGVDAIFTLSGGHIFSIYDGAVKAKWRIVDVRHEQTATWAAEGMAKLTRKPGVVPWRRRGSGVRGGGVPGTSAGGGVGRARAGVAGRGGGRPRGPRRPSRRDDPQPPSPGRPPAYRRDRRPNPGEGRRSPQNA